MLRPDLRPALPPDIVGPCRRAGAHADETIAALPQHAVGPTPGAPGETTLHRVLTHVVAETQRHAGRVDVVRELVSGALGQRPGGLDVAAPRPRAPRPGPDRRRSGPPHAPASAPSPCRRRPPGAGSPGPRPACAGRG
ncbi:mycothiol transferase [Streptomyces flaveolus]|uniref:mycothiol transferase n=1 Tax=Streptomyces flaveolus TaxID=67297 RepID=UPI0033CBF309